MSSELWHGLSHQKAWSNVGDSYSQLSQECKLKAQTNPLLASSRISPNSVPAGLLSSAKPRGAGSFQLQVSFIECYLVCLLYTEPTFPGHMWMPLPFRASGAFQKMMLDTAHTAQRLQRNTSHLLALPNLRFVVVADVCCSCSWLHAWLVESNALLMPGVTGAEGKAVQLPKGDLSFRLQVCMPICCLFCFCPAVSVEPIRFFAYRTHKQIDFDAMRLVDCKKPGRAQRPADSESILGTYPADANLPGPAAAATPTQVC